MGPGTGSPCGPLCPGCPVGPHPSGPQPHLAGSQNLLQVQVPGEVECASLRLMEVPRDVAVAGKRVTGVRPPVVLHSVSQTSISVPKTLMRLKTGFSHAGLEWRKTGETRELTEAGQAPLCQEKGRGPRDLGASLPLPSPSSSLFTRERSNFMGKAVKSEAG